MVNYCHSSNNRMAFVLLLQINWFYIIWFPDNMLYNLSPPANTYVIYMVPITLIKKAIKGNQRTWNLISRQHRIYFVDIAENMLFVNFILCYYEVLWRKRILAWSFTAETETNSPIETMSIGEPLVGGSIHTLKQIRRHQKNN